MPATILVVDDEDNFRENIKQFLTSLDYEVLEAPTLEEARKQVDSGNADIILLDVQLPDGYGPELLEETRHLPERPPIILITAYGDIEMAVAAMKNGAFDFLQKPIKFEILENTIQTAEEIVAMRRELDHYRQERQKELADIHIGNSPTMKLLVAQATRAAELSAAVLLTGETGTGKEVMARAIAEMGARKGKPFIDINCAAIQPTMLESELFGHEAGAFTHATKRKHGLMEVADKGILFLDEISSMPVDMQAKILTAIDEQEFRRVGGNKVIKVDVQVISASNRNLPAMIQEGKFREDLYYRLKVVELVIPPLRERKEEIPELVGLFIRKKNPRMGLNIRDVTPQAMEALVAYDWPGNIRELKNAVERAMLFCDDPAIDIQHLPVELQQIAVLDPAG
jgi:DNA-binding NtrC family response regulator